MKFSKKITALAAALLTAALPCSSYASASIMVEIIPETSEVSISVDPNKDKIKISPYIFGMNVKGDMSGISPTVIKQTGSELSTYNWETNYSNPGAEGFNANDVSLIKNYPSSKWSSPALYTDSLYSRSLMDGINVRLVTLQMMGYVAKDSMGIVSDDELSKNTRWCTVSFNKNDTYSNQPDTDDDVVYIDEYVSYLVNRYGLAAEGGINGYFLDTDPDLWASRFSVLGLDQITPDELINRSEQLSLAVKTIDNKAFVFGPSLSGLQGCINLNNPDAWDEKMHSGKEYFWFIDYYLSEMKRVSEENQIRLLDVLDIHYYTEAMTPVGTSVLTGDDPYCNAYRMQAVKTLWDPEFTENSITVLYNKQFTPLIPTLQASIRTNYPGTRLSFSEYDFGGGSNISGAIAQTDVLGTFAKENVYLACLSPVLGDYKDYKFQKSAIRLYTDYDGQGSSFGDTMVYAENNGDNTSSVFAAIDEDKPEKLRIILTNKNMVNQKHFDISINSDSYIYELSQAYTIDKGNAEIIEADLEMFKNENNTLSFDADTTSIYMLVLDGKNSDETNGTETSESVWQTETAESITVSSEGSTTTVSSETESSSENNSTSVSDSETETQTVYESDTEQTTAMNPANSAAPGIPEVTKVTSDSVTISSSESMHSESRPEESEIITDPISSKNEAVSAPIKIIVSILAGTVFIGVAYILIFDKK